MHSRQKGTIHPIALAVFIVVVVIVGGVYLLYASGQLQRMVQSPTPAPTPTYTSGLYISNKPIPSPLPTHSPKPSASAAATAGWKTYTNITFGFSLKYPPDLQVQSLGPNQAELDSRAGKQISGTVVPSLDTILFSKSANEVLWSIDIFGSRDWNISEAGFEKDYLYMKGSCDLRWGSVYSQDLHLLTVQGTPVLEAAVTFDVRDYESDTMIRIYKDCYYVKNLAGNLLVFNLSAGSKAEFTENYVLIQRALNTLQFTK